ncbi:MAG: EAL domain-containing protein [Methylophilaceae bacterium]|nr:EAL domain-containing protein [Methylophilaceae bacterium]
MSVTPDVYLGRQPILDRAQNVVAYELLFRSGDMTSSGVADDLLASANVIINTISQFGIDSVLGGQTGFLNVSEALLMSDALELLPPERIVLEILETVAVDDRLIDRCRELKEKGFRLALDDFTYHAMYDPMFELVDIVKLDLLAMDTKEVERTLQRLRQWPHLQLLAEKVEDHQHFQQCKELGFALFQGYFFARPTILAGKRANPNQLTLMKVLDQLMRDVEIPEIERTFKENPTLTLGLLRLVNSVAMGLQHKVGSVRQALVVLGRRQLQRWVQLLLYARSNGEIAGPLMTMAAVRARLMENLCRTLPGQGQKEEVVEQAFMTGILSLVDVVLGMPMEEVLRQFGLADEVRNAVLKKEGLLGQLLTLMAQVEAGEFGLVSDSLARLGLTVETFNKAQLEAIQWAANLDREIQG